MNFDPSEFTDEQLKAFLNVIADAGMTTSATLQTAILQARKGLKAMGGDILPPGAEIGIVAIVLVMNALMVNEGSTLSTERLVELAESLREIAKKAGVIQAKRKRQSGMAGSLKMEIDETKKKDKSDPFSAEELMRLFEES